MVGSAPHRAGSHQPKPATFQQQGNFPNPERDRNDEIGRFWEGSVNTTQTRRSHSRVGNHISQRQNDEQAMQREINDLKRKLRHEEHYQRHKHRSPPPKGLGHDAMSRALDQLFKSPFTHCIEEATLPRRFQ